MVKASVRSLTSSSSFISKAAFFMASESESPSWVRKDSGNSYSHHGKDEYCAYCYTLIDIQSTYVLYLRAQMKTNSQENMGNTCPWV